MSESEINPSQALEPQVPATNLPETAAGIFDCWNQTGVRGDGSCPELEEFTHCRNCPVYANAGPQLLNRTLPPGYRQEWTAYFADKRKPPAGSRISVVIFRVEGEWLALPARTFQEVAEPRPVHSIPHRRHGVLLGFVNIRGELLLCVSVGRLLGLGRGDSLEKLRTCYDRLLVTLWEGKRLVFPADEVHGLCRLHPEEITGPPMTIAGVTATFAQGVFCWEDKLVGLLEAESLFTTLHRSFS